MFLALFVPAILLFSIDSIQSNAFNKNTSEVGELIKEEGGVVGRAYSAVQDLRDIGYEISYSPKGAVEYGERVTVTYKKKYKNFFTGEKELKSTQVYEILRRHSAGTETDDGNRNNNNSVIQNITLTSNKLTNNGEYLQTFTIPNLKRIINITANTGSAEVSSISGNQVTIRMKNGDPIIEKIGASEEKRKYVEDYDQPYYEDAEGYKGILEKYVEGEYKPKEVKYVSGWDSEYYEDAEGFTGKLEKYVASGVYIEEDSKEVTHSVTYGQGKTIPATYNYLKDGYKGTLTKVGNPVEIVREEYIPAHTKWVTNQTSSYYNQDGYTGYLSRYEHDREYVPAHTKWVTNQTSPYYNSDGYSGTLSKYLHSGSYTPADSKFVTGQTSPYYSDSDGYRGMLVAYLSHYITVPYTYHGGMVSTYIQIPVFYYQGIVTKPAVDTRVYRYEGYVTRPAYENIIYRYQGYVTRPAMNTRIYEYVQNYRGVVTRPEIDTRVYKYHGTVSKPEKDTRVYKYRGYVTKPATEGIENKYYQYLLNIQYEAWN